MSSDRTPDNYAIEHAGYLAEAAKWMLDMRNQLDGLVVRRDDGEEVDDDLMHAAQEAADEASNRVRIAIHEFEKRRDRAAAAPPAQNADLRQFRPFVQKERHNLAASVDRLRVKLTMGLRPDVREKISEILTEDETMMKQADELLCLIDGVKP